MRGLLADVNLQGHLPYLCHVLRALDLWNVLTELGLEVLTFRDVGFAPDLDDRTLWHRCQQAGLVLLTENRNHDGADSLEATLADSWRPGHLPILTLANKGKLEHSRGYAERVATDIAELLFGIRHGEYLQQSRIYVPR